MKTTAAYSPPHTATVPKFDIDGFTPITRSATDRITVHSNPATALAALGSSARAEHVDKSSALGGLLNAAGRQAFTLTLENGRLVQLTATTASAIAAGDPDEFISMATASALLHHGPTWLSRTRDGQKIWEWLGLNPRRSGRNLLFKRGEIIAHLEQQAVRRRGRPRRVTANVAE